MGDVLDFALTSDEWPGDFGFVDLRLHLGHFDGEDVYFIRTDASDQEFAETEELVFAPKLSDLATDELSGRIYLVGDAPDGQGAVVSSQPEEDDWTPALRVSRVSFTGDPVELRSVDEVEEAADAGDVEVEETDIILNAAIVKWSGGELAVDEELEGYLGGGQLIERPDTDEMRVRFKLHECYPEARYIVIEHSLEGPATNTNTILAPKLQEGPREAGATGRTNVFGNGLEGPGPMGFQPSVFDSKAGDPVWSPYWDHFLYLWEDDAEPRLLTSEDAIHDARDDGELEEIPGVPPTDGTIFTVNCPVPVIAPNTFEVAGAEEPSRLADTGDGSRAR